jgi:hypothetical protein
MSCLAPSDNEISYRPITVLVDLWLGRSASLLELVIRGHASNSFYLVTHIVGAAECWQLKLWTWNECGPGAW